MEDKKKNKIFIVSSCVIASLVIALVIALMPQMQLKANRNVYQDEMTHGNVDGCVQYATTEECTTDSGTKEGGCTRCPVSGADTCYNMDADYENANTCVWYYTKETCSNVTDYSTCVRCGTAFNDDGHGGCTPKSTSAPEPSCSSGEYLDSDNGCNYCPAGSYCPGDNKSYRCAAGTYSGAGASSCTSCTGNTYSSAGASSCSTCPSGKTANASNTACIDRTVSCDAGEYAGGDGYECDYCPAGSYCPGDNKSYRCAAGTYSGAGASSCTSCTGNTYSSAGASSCSTCPSGKTANGSNTACIDRTVSCDAGEYAGGDGYECDYCPAGSYCPGDNKSYRCAAGTYSGAGASSCTYCLGNTYSGAGASSCLDCGAGKKSNASHTACEDATINCKAGEYLDSDMGCNTCIAGSYCPGDDTSHTCPGGYTSSNGASAQSQCYVDVPAGYELTSAGGSPTQCTGNTIRSISARVNYGSTTGGCSPCGEDRVANESHTACGIDEISCCRLGSDGKYSWKNGKGADGCASLIIADCAEHGKLNEPITEKDCIHENQYWTGTKCIECPSGYNGSSGNCCISVPAGSYLTSAGSPGTSSCPVGTYSSGGLYCLTGGSNESVVGRDSCTNCPKDTTSKIGSSSSDSCVPISGECSVSVSTSATTVSPAGNGHYADNFTADITVSGDGCNGGKLNVSGINASCGSPAGTVYNGMSFHVTCKATASCVEAGINATVTTDKKTYSDSATVQTSSPWRKIKDNDCVEESDYISHYHSAEAADDELDYELVDANHPITENTKKVVKDNPNMHYTLDGSYDAGKGACTSGLYEVDVWVRGCDGDGDSTYTSPPNPTYACYADAKEIKDVRKASWTIGATEELPFKITTDVNGKKITSSTQCAPPTNKYCYANANNLDEATQADMLTGPKDKLQYQIKDSNGNPVTDVNLCTASACYVENGTTNYKWAHNGTLDKDKYTKVAIYNKDDCTFVEVCMAKPGKDDFEEVSWVKSKSSIDAKIKEGWVEISGIDSEAQCNPGACYQKNSDPTEFVWFSTGQDHTGYTKVDSSKCEAPSPEPYTSPACYVHSLDNGTVKYEWGDYSKQAGYMKINIKEEYCISSNSCYLYTKDGTYHNGDYSLNDDYIMVDDANCKKIPAPRTSIDKSTLMYVAMLCLAIAGVGLTYYGNLKRKKFN